MPTNCTNLRALVAPTPQIFLKTSTNFSCSLMWSSRLRCPLWTISQILSANLSPTKGRLFASYKGRETHDKISASYSCVLEARNKHFPNHRMPISCMETRIQRDNRIPREQPSPSMRYGFSGPPCTITHARVHGKQIDWCLVGWSEAGTVCHINN